MDFVEIEFEILDLPMEEFLKYISNLNTDVNLIRVKNDYLILWLIHRNRFDIIERLEKLDLTVSSLGESGITPLHYACKKNNINIVNYLLDRDMDPNKKDNNNCTPLHYCHGHNNRYMEIASLLLKRGVDINSKDIRGRTILYNACRTQTLDMVDFLLENGAEIEYENGEVKCLSNENLDYYVPDKIKEELSDIFLKYRMKRVKGISRVE